MSEAEKKYPASIRPKKKILVHMRDFEKQLVPVPISATRPPPQESNGLSLSTVESQVPSSGPFLKLKKRQQANKFIWSFASFISAKCSVISLVDHVISNYYSNVMVKAI